MVDTKPQSTPAMRFGRVDGSLYVLWGVAGFALGLLPPISVLDSGTLAAVVVNPWHSAFHVVLGVSWVLASRTGGSAKFASLAVGLITGAVAILGYCGYLDFVGVSGIAAPDNFIHLCTSIVGLYYGSAGAESSKVVVENPDSGSGNMWDISLSSAPSDRRFLSSDANPWLTGEL